MLTVVLTGMVFAGSAWANARWVLASRAAPTNLPPGGEGLLIVGADDFGNVGVNGSTNHVTLTDVLPTGLKVSDPKAVNPHWSRGGQSEKEKEETWNCTVTQEERVVTCTTSLNIPAYERLEIEIPIRIDQPAGTVTTLANQVNVSGGEEQGSAATVPPASLMRSVRVDPTPVAYGVEPEGFSFATENKDGTIDTQAGSHPYQLTSTVNFNETLEEIQLPGQTRKLAPGAPALSKTLNFRLPPGLLGNVNAAEQCSGADFAALEGTTGGTRDLCPPGSAIGVATVAILVPSTVGYKTIAVPVFNLEPAQGEPARFGFETEAVPVVIDTTVATDSDYGVTATVKNATAAAQVLGAQVTFWGDPSDPSHDNSRGWACLRDGFEKLEGESCNPPDPRTTTPFLTLPTSCTGGLSSLMTGEAWTNNPLQTPPMLEETYAFKNQTGEPLTSLENCSQLPFEPALKIRPEQEEHQAVTSASTPTGLDATVMLPQEGTLTNGLLGDADVRTTSVTLPQGMSLNPGAANGLEACSEPEVGYEGPGGTDPFSPGAPEPLHFNLEKTNCPEGSKLGRVRIKTPLLDEELTGWVYLAEQDHNPFGSLIALYIVAENPKLGLTVKLAGEGHLEEGTGLLTTTFANTPQVPFEEFDLELFGGIRGPLTTPALCGTYSATSSFESWSGTVSQPVSQPGFAIGTGPGGGPCLPDPQPFAPGFQVGSTNLQAGGFTGFELSLDNPDGDQALTGLTVQLPKGVAALLSTVEPCGEPQAAQGTCGAASRVGSSVASSGYGPEPVNLEGQVYLTGPYDGAPFGIEVVTPAVAGPFNLGDVIVRSRILVNRETAQVTIVSDPFPTFVKGVPVDLKQIKVSVDRPDFEFNPTSCDPTTINATLTGAQGAATSPSSPFQVSGCGNLPFKPVFTASTSGNATKANGASFVVKVTSKGLGEADIEKVDLQLPKALPARLTTLQKACTEGTFNVNPASCPEGSVIGTAVIHTPVLKNPLTGPAYLVSHGGAAFPDVEFVLQGENITLVLDGKTAIKNQITYSKFEAAPDAPFTTFETILPQGPHSALTSNVPAKAKFSLCGQTLNMPTEITAHNGTLIKQTTKITVQGCKAVKANRTKKLTRTQQLALALKTCHKHYKHNQHKRQTCERQAHKRYAPKKTSARKHSAAQAHKARTSS
jgi:hypothetical protein